MFVYLHHNDKIKTVMTVKEIREALMTPGTIFKAPVGRFKDRMKEFSCREKTTLADDGETWINTGEVDSICIVDHYLYDGMNVERFGPTCVWLYTFDMLSQKSVGKIRYEDVVILETKTHIFVDGQVIIK